MGLGDECEFSTAGDGGSGKLRAVRRSELMGGEDGRCGDSSHVA